jgi:N,N-dimethylformamidase
MPRIRDDVGNELIGYVDRWSAAPGEPIRLMVSASAPQVGVRLVRLRHGDPNPEGPGYRAAPVASEADGTYAARLQSLQAGSRASIDDGGSCRTLGVWVWPTRPAAGREQLLVRRGDVAIVLDPGGRVRLRRGDAEVVGGVLERERWVRVVGVAGADRLTLAVSDRLEHVPSGGAELAGPILLAGDAEGRRCFEGRLEEPFCFERALDAGELGAELAPDRRFDLRAATLVNAPATAVTGRRWQDDTTDFRSAPDEYAAVHFHSDDLEDAGWEPTLSFQVPADLASGVYAFELEAGGLRDEVPFVVRPARDGPHARIGLLLPTLTYQVYGNERLIAGGERSMAPTPSKIQPCSDPWLAAVRRKPGALSGASDCDAKPTPTSRLGSRPR